MTAFGRESAFLFEREESPDVDHLIPACWCSKWGAAAMQRPNGNYVIAVVEQGNKMPKFKHIGKSWWTSHDGPTELDCSPDICKPISSLYIEIVDDIRNSETSDWFPVGPKVSPLQVLAEHCGLDEEDEASIDA